MNVNTLLENIGIAIFGILALIFFILGLYAIKRDPRYPPNEARRKSLIKSTIYLFFVFVSLDFLAGLLKPDGITTIVCCFIGEVIFLGFYLGFQLLQYRLFEKLKFFEKFENRKAKDNPTDIKGDKKNL
jgi:hypothetical protein